LNLPPAVEAELEALLSGVQEVLGGNLVGVYLRGSLATGEFVPETSDLDVLAATEYGVSDTTFAALADMHVRLGALPNPYAKRVEMAYVDRAALKRFEPGQRHPTLGQGESLQWTEHFTNWILERWTLREHEVRRFVQWATSVGEEEEGWASSLPSGRESFTREPMT
jgi:predicted nucleotidyltransferase